MKYLSVAEMAKKWKISERTVGNYCSQGQPPDAFLTGKTWNIPDIAVRLNVSTNIRTSQLHYWRF